MEKLIGILRRPDGLYALILREESETKIRPEDLGERLDWEACRFHITEQPLESIRTVQSRHLQDAWKHLQCVVKPDTQTLAQVMRVLGETIAPDLPVAVLPALEWEGTNHNASIHPTAAHTRAYRGTKYQPPKAKVPPAVDLRPYLCDRRGVSMLRHSLKRYRQEAIRLLEREGLSLPVTWEEDCDLYAAIQHGATVPLTAGVFPSAFRGALLPTLAGRDWSVVTTCLSLFWKLDLAGDAALRQAVTCLLCLQPDDVGLRWCERMVALPAEWRLTFAILLLETEAYHVDPESLSQQEHQTFLNALNRVRPAYQLYCLLRAVAKRIALDYMETGLQLAGEDDLKQCGEVERSGYFPDAAVLALCKHLHCDGDTPRNDDGARKYSFLLWRHCGRLPGLGQIIARIDWKRYTVDVARNYFEVYRGAAWGEDLSLQERDAKWKPRAAATSRFTAVLEAAPEEYRYKCALFLKTISWFFEEETVFTECLNYALATVSRLSRPPFSTDSIGDEVLFGMLLNLQDAERERLLSASDNSLLKLEAAVRSSNSAWLIERGTENLCCVLGTFTVDCLLQLPAKLCRVAKALGCLSYASQKRVLHETADLPLFSIDLLSMTLEEKEACLKQIQAEQLSNPIPAPLLRYWRGERQLQPVQVAHHLARMQERLLLVRLEMIEKQAWRRTVAGFEQLHKQEAGTHALQIRPFVEENRRALQKFLRAYRAGDTHYIEAHPLTRNWLHRHPGLDTEKWCRGLVYEAYCSEHGTVRIAVETDPLEVLKLGTYVGSCLGLGGGLSYSAAAVTLDINKQVLYARNATGKVVARQLLAISEADELVCFALYPAHAGTDLKRLFAAANTAFRCQLGLPRFVAGDDREYNIAHILSHTWYDDGAWEGEEAPASDKQLPPSLAGKGDRGG